MRNAIKLLKGQWRDFMLSGIGGGIFAKES